MSHRSSARWLAPLALVTCAVAVYAVALSGLGGAGTGAPARTAQPSTKRTGKPSHATTSKAASAPKKTYTVQSGDTLSAIAAKTGVGLARIQALNPNVDTRALHAGQKIKLRP
jgi:LysM repeat protein